MAKPKWYEARNEIAKFALPLMEKFSSKHYGYPGSLADEFDGDGGLANRRWEEILNEIEWALRQIKNGNLIHLTPAEYERVDAGCQLFGKWFLDLWD